MRTECSQGHQGHGAPGTARAKPREFLCEVYDLPALTAFSGVQQFSFLFPTSCVTQGKPEPRTSYLHPTPPGKAAMHCVAFPAETVP